MNRIIQYFRNKINILEEYLSRRDVILIIVIISVSVTSFVLGYHAASQSVAPIVTMRDSLCRVPITESSIKEGEKLLQGTNIIVASKNGSRYYFVWCSGVSRIAAKNRVYFQTVEAAEKKGYTKASGCN